MTSFVRKSAPICGNHPVQSDDTLPLLARLAGANERQKLKRTVALYAFEKRFVTYWVINDVLPTPESPRMMTWPVASELAASVSFANFDYFIVVWDSSLLHTLRRTFLRDAMLSYK